jgi:hypothetical protein
MAKRKEGHEVLFVEVPVELKGRLRVVADRNHRSMVGEAVVALERHVAAEEEARPAVAVQSKKAKKGGAK